MIITVAREPANTRLSRSRLRAANDMRPSPRSAANETASLSACGLRVLFACSLFPPCGPLRSLLRPLGIAAAGPEQEIGSCCGLPAFGPRFFSRYPAAGLVGGRGSACRLASAAAPGFRRACRAARGLTLCPPSRKPFAPKDPALKGFLHFPKSEAGATDTQNRAPQTNTTTPRIRGRGTPPPGA